MMRPASLPTQPDTNYKDLYLECKKNVAIFMKHVDTEMTNILNTHAQEKRKLEEEIQRLKLELKEKNCNTSINLSKVSTAQSHSKRNNSESKVVAQSTISKQTVEECLAKFNRYEFKPKETPDKKLRWESNGREDRRSTIKSINEDEKQNFIAANFNEQMEWSELKLTNTSSRREKRVKEKKIGESQKVENIKDLLKDMRGRVSSRQKSQREKDEPIVNIISPDMFSMQRRP